MTSAELAEPVGVLDRREMAADEVRAALGLDLDDPPVLERELEVRIICARLSGRLERSVPLGPPGIRRDEDLLGRHVGDVVDTAGGAEAGAAPVCARQEADGEVGSRPGGTGARRAAAP